MIREIVKDINKLNKSLRKVNPAEKVMVKPIIEDLLDTAESLGDICLGLTANQIGYDKKICVVKNVDTFRVIINPIIINKIGEPFESKEKCLSLEGERTAKRWPVVDVFYMDARMKIHKERFCKMAAVVIQHEIDHTNGIII